MRARTRPSARWCPTCRRRPTPPVTSCFRRVTPRTGCTSSSTAAYGSPKSDSWCPTARYSVKWDCSRRRTSARSPPDATATAVSTRSPVRRCSSCTTRIRGSAFSSSGWSQASSRNRKSPRRRATRRQSCRRIRSRSELGLHVREHRENAPTVVLARWEAELVEDRAHVLLHGGLGDVQTLADRPVRAAFGDQLEHLVLARRQRSQRAVVSGVRQQRRHHLGIEGGAAAGHPSQRAGEVRRVRHAVLEQIAEALRRLGQQLRGDADLHVLREQHDAHVRMAAADLVRGLDALVGLRRRHADVDDGHIGLVLVHRREQLVGARGLGDDFDAPAPYERRDALAHERAVVRDHDAHGRSAVITVPIPGGLRTRSVPSSAATRPASPWSPLPPVSSAPPTPSSVISTTATPSRRETRTDAFVACAYFATLASASQLTK